MTPSYSSGSHYGFQGAEVIKISASAPKAVTPTGSWIGSTPVSPVEVTDVGSGPVTKYTGTTSTPPQSLVSTS